jgi:hypothetical protein
MGPDEITDEITEQPRESDSVNIEPSQTQGSHSTTTPEGSNAEESYELSLEESTEDQPQINAQDDEANNNPLDDFVEILGEKRKAKEWKDGFIMRQDYTKKTQQIAEEKRKLQQMEAEFNKSKALNLSLSAKQAKERLEKFEKIDWDTVLKEKPQEAIKLKVAEDNARKNYEKTINEQQEFFNYHNQLEQQTILKNAEYCKQELERDVKGWNSENYQKLINYGVKQGIPKEELLNCTNPKIFKLLIKASKFDKGLSLKNKKTGNTTQMMSSHKKFTPVNDRVKTRNESVKLLRKNGGRTKDAVNAFKSIL